MINITINELKKRKLDKCYIAMYVVTYPVPVRKDELIQYKELLIIYGVNIHGKRKFIDMLFNNSHNNRFWLEEFEYIKSRGVETILFLIADRNKNIDKAIKILYSNTTVIDSAIDIINKFNKYLPCKRSSDIGQKFKKLFLVYDINAFELELQLIKDDIKDYNILLIILEENLNRIKDYYKYCAQIRKLVFPYFSIRDMHYKLRKAGNSVEYFNNLDEVIAALLEYINSFERGSSYHRKEWLELMNIIYSKYTIEIGGYI